MQFGRAAYYSPTFRGYKAIPEHEFRERVRYYEAQESSILTLEFDEYLEIAFNYSICLFEIGAYAKYLPMADILIRTSMEENVTHYKGKNLLCHLLFKKGAAHFNLMQYLDAEHMLRELLKIDPDNKDAAELLIKNARQQSPRFWKVAKATSIGLFLISALIICFEVLVVRPLYENFTFPIELTRTLIFATGLLILIGTYGFHHWRSRKKVDCYVKVCKRRRAAKGLD